MENNINNLNNLNIEEKEVSRSKVIIRTSIIGILANVLLAGFKAAVGLLTHSIAIVLDAVNNFSDAASSLVTSIGTKLAGKQPDKKHPFGHGRIEYLSAMLISIIILYAGITSLVESVKKIITPQTPEYTVPSLIVVAVAVAVKIVLGRYVKSVGQKVNSDSLVNSGEDARLDAVISASTLIAAIIFLKTGLSLEAWLGAVISLLIIKAGVGMLSETISRLLGERGDIELSQKIKETVKSFPDVAGAYDLVLNNYGPDSYNGSIHIEVPDTYTASELDELIRAITMKVYQEHHVLLTAVGVYSTNTKDPQAIAMRERLNEIVMAHEHILQTHGFYVDTEKKTMRFDVVVSFDAGDRWSLYEHIIDDVQKEWPDYTIEAIMDTDFSEA